MRIVWSLIQKIKMETEGKTTIGILLALIATFLLVGDTDLEPTHYCEIKEIKAHCFEISSSGITCYTQPNKIGGKQCRGGQWEEIPEEIENIKKSNYGAPSGDIHCTNKGCL